MTHPDAMAHIGPIIAERLTSRGTGGQPEEQT
jgi:hypothetical protein